MLRSTRILALSLALTALACAPAAAQTAPASVAPDDGATIDADAFPPFSARGDGMLTVRLARTPGVLDRCTPVSGNVVELPGTPAAGDPTLQTFTLPRALAPGLWYWQVVRRSPCAHGEVRKVTVTPGSGIDPVLPSAPEVPDALPRLSRAHIPLRIGTSNHAQMVLATAGVPAGVTRARFATLVRNSAARWRIGVHGPVNRMPALRDGHSDIGFNPALVPSQALGITLIQTRTRIHVRYRCIAGRCTTTRQVGPTQVVERDVAFRTDVPWEAGPAHPDLGHVDLETAIIHELGHAAGNARHAALGCRDTPMVVGLANGEWWRSPQDWSFRSCAAGARAAARMAVVHLDQQVVVAG
jgi:hypothetical protein